MKLRGLTQLLRSNTRYQEMLGQLGSLADNSPDGSSRGLMVLGVLEAARPFVVAALQEDWLAPMLVLCSTPESARQLADQVRVWAAQPDDVLYFHAPDATFYDRTSWDRETIHSRASVLARLVRLRDEGAQGAGHGLVIIASVWSLMAKSAPPMALRRAVRTLRVGDLLSPYELLAHLVHAGYEAEVTVETPGTFGHRGSIVDVYPPNLPSPIRIDFFGDQIDTIRAFDPTTQRSAQQLEQVTVVPASEALPEWGKQAASELRAIGLKDCQAATRARMLDEIDALARGEHFAGIEFYLPYLYPRPGTLLDFLPQGALVAVDDSIGAASAALSLENQAQGLRADMIAHGHLPADFTVPYLTWSDLYARLVTRGAITLGYAEDDTPPFYGEKGFLPAAQYGGQLQHALEDVVNLQRESRRVVVVTRQAERLADLLQDLNVYTSPLEELSNPPALGTVSLVNGIASEGWSFDPSDLVVLTDAEIFGWARIRRRSTVRRRAASPEALFADLQVGDYVVHVEYGIGRYHGMVHKTIGHLEREYLELEYASGDRLYVPIYQADRVSRYLGADDREPYLHRLGGAEWRTARTRAERAVRDMAVELLELYAAREIAPGYAFSPDVAWQRELEASFPYEETPDQLRALEEVKRDMAQPRPMDRLICGDVGYGKTEVALRAAFKAVMDNKQVAVLVPTTVLAQQHFHTFRRRLRAFPVAVEMLSRFLSPREQDEVIEGLTAGRVDIVIGTHRLLSKDVAFKDLGLLIIDEEQRFGVGHKEQLKQMRREVDVLTLTATPIPRTLYLALSGARDMSVIDTPPEDRLPVHTVVTAHDESLIRNGILREIDRGGQVYFVHNRVEDIYHVADQLQRLVPEASLTVGHGQMDEDELAQVMLGFAQGEYDVLVCTTIIESGLDIPNVNTILIDRADTFGLAQLYQLRGRVGRGTNRAYAYLFYNPGAPLSEVARKRLQTIQEASELGAGYRVAMRDMEIRGAGEILGAEQHGHIVAIGFDLYLRLLKGAVEELRAVIGAGVGAPSVAIQRAQERVAASLTPLGVAPSIDLPLSAYLPEAFMPDNQLRLRFYRRLAQIDSDEMVDELAQELRDRFGDLPKPVVNLLYLLRVRALAMRADVEAISSEDQRIAVALPHALPPSLARQLEAEQPGVRARGTRAWLSAKEAWQPALENLLRCLTELSTVIPRS